MLKAMLDKIPELSVRAERYVLRDCAASVCGSHLVDIVRFSHSRANNRRKNNNNISFNFELRNKEIIVSVWLFSMFIMLTLFADYDCMVVHR